MRKPKFSLEFDMDNAAFEHPYTNEEVARILLDIHNRVKDGVFDHGNIFDVNGNRIGQWSMDMED